MPKYTNANTITQMQKRKCKFTGSRTSVCGKEASPSPNSLISLTLSSCPEETFTCDRWPVQDERVCKLQSKQPKLKAQVCAASQNVENCNKNCLVYAHISFPSGACIPLANKCNSKIDCFEDESDESHCSYLEVWSFYVLQICFATVSQLSLSYFQLKAYWFLGAPQLCRPAESQINKRGSCSSFYQCLDSGLSSVSLCCYTFSLIYWCYFFCNLLSKSSFAELTRWTSLSLQTTTLI